MTTPYEGTQPDWLLVEDDALRVHLKGVTVTDGSNATRPVGVWFGQPDMEIRSQSYPYLTIDLVDISENTAQVMSSYGRITSDALLARLPAGDDDFALTGEEFLTPMMLTYQVTSYARMPRHDRQILSALNHGRLHQRFAFILCPDDTRRRLVVRDFAKRDAIADGKRLFRNAWTVQIPTEIVYDEVALTRRVEQVMLNPDAIIRVTQSAITPPIYYPGDD